MNNDELLNAVKVLTELECFLERLGQVLKRFGRRPSRHGDERSDLLHNRDSGPQICH
jgi:hypothetical protein